MAWGRWWAWNRLLPRGILVMGDGPEMQPGHVCVCQALPLICSRVLSHGSRSSQKIRITALRYIHLHHIEDRSYYAISGFPIPPSSSYFIIGGTSFDESQRLRGIGNTSISPDMIGIIIWLQSKQRITSWCHQLISSPWCIGLKRKFCDSDNIL